MTEVLSKEHESELILRGFTRRSFFRFAAMVAGASAMPFYDEPAMAQLSKITNVPPGAVMINANENPLGPCPEAMEASTTSSTRAVAISTAKQTNCKLRWPSRKALISSPCASSSGSSPALHQAVLAFTSPTRPLVTADPGYEAGGRAANFIGSPVIKVPLTSTYAHDVKAMAAASPTAGLIYLCNPNNPTGTLTPKSEIEWLVANKPAGSIVMIDEAYTHISGAPFNSDLVAQGKDVVILADILEDLRHGRLARRRRFRTSRSNEETQWLGRHDDAHYGNGGSHRQPCRSRIWFLRGAS